MKVFCIGLHKTGTVSLEKALQRLGFKTRHGYVKHSNMIKTAMHKGLKPLQLLHDKIGFNDSEDTAYLDLYAIRDHFVKMDEEYPGSKFILTIRDMNQWVESVKKQIIKRPNSPYFHHYYFQSELQWVYFHNMHIKTVLAFFDVYEKRDQLLIMNIANGDGYEVLCKFLDREIINEPFPHENKSPEE